MLKKGKLKKRLSKKQIKRLASVLGVGVAVSTASVYGFSQTQNSELTEQARAAEKARLATDAIFEKGKDIPFEVD